MRKEELWDKAELVPGAQLPVSLNRAHHFVKEVQWAFDPAYDSIPQNSVSAWHVAQYETALDA